MPYLDLSHSIEMGMPVYPGTEPPEIREANTFESDGFREKRISLHSHTGTHMDAPSHILPGAKSLDDLPVGAFTGGARLLDVRHLEGRRITLPNLKDLLGSAGDLGETDFLLLRTGWDQYWGTEAYFSAYPTLDKDAAAWLASHQLKGLGLDCISADVPSGNELPIHRILLTAGMLIIENLCHLDRVPSGSFEFFGFPLPIHDADGSPVRAVARV